MTESNNNKNQSDLCDGKQRNFNRGRIPTKSKKDVIVTKGRSTAESKGTLFSLPRTTPQNNGLSL